MKRGIKGLTLVELMIWIGIGAIILAIAIPSFVKAKNQPHYYEVWCKQTGNPHQLTLEEWKIWINKCQPVITVVQPIQY